MTLVADLNEATRQCISGVLGRMPSDLSDLTDEEKQRLGQECFNRQRATGERRGGGGGAAQRAIARANRARAGQGTRIPGRTGFGQQATGAAPTSQADAGQPDDSDNQDDQGTTATTPSSSGSGTAPSFFSSGRSPAQPGSDQPEAGGQTAADVEVEAPEEAPALDLTDKERAVQDVIHDFSETAVMEPAGVIARLASIEGSLVAGIKRLVDVNHLLVKGKSVTDEEWREVFGK